MKKLLFMIVTGIDKLTTGVSKVALWLIFPIVGIMLYEVIVRYFVGRPTLWATELATMVFGVYMFFAGPWSVLKKVQVGVDIFSSKWSRRTQAIVNTITYVFTFILFFSLLYTSFKYAVESWEMKEVSTSAWSPIVYPFKMIIPVAFSLMMLQTFAEFLRNVWMACTGEELE